MERLEPTHNNEVDIEVLKDQFNTPHFFELESGEVLKYTLVEPDHVDEQTEWVVIVGGFSSTKEMWEEEVLDLAHSGKRVVFVTPDKGTDPNDDENAFFDKNAESIPDTIRNKAVAVKRLIDNLGIKFTNLVGQSQGGAVVTTLVSMYPEIAEKVLLDSPAGIAKQSLGSFYGRAIMDSINSNILKPKVDGEIHPELLAKDKAQWDEYNAKFKKHIGWRITQEIPDIARVDVLPLLEKIKRNREETGAAFPQIVLLNANNDTVFQAKGIEKSMGFDEKTDLPKEDGSQWDTYVDNWLMYADKDMGHGKYQRPVPGMLPTIFSEDRRGSVIKKILG